MIETHPRHLPDNDPTGRPRPLWPQRRSSQIAFNRNEGHTEDNIRHASQKGSANIAPDVGGVAQSLGVETSIVMDKNLTLSIALAQASQSRDTGSASTIDDLGRRKSYGSSPSLDGEKDKVQKLSSAQIHELTSSPDSIPIRAVPEETLKITSRESSAISSISPLYEDDSVDPAKRNKSSPKPNETSHGLQTRFTHPDETAYTSTAQGLSRPMPLNRAVSTPASGRVKSPKEDSSFRAGKQGRNAPAPLKFDPSNEKISMPLSGVPQTLPSPMPASIPLPPLSLPTYLQLELASTRPSPLYIHRSATNDFPYESSRAKIERLQNFLLLPLHLEQVLWFGTLACLDVWLYTFTILPLRFLKALSILGRSWGLNVVMEAQFIMGFVYQGSGRLWERRKSRGASVSGVATRGYLAPEESFQDQASTSSGAKGDSRRLSEAGRASKASRKHKRSRSTPSNLLPDDKADILKGLLIIATCVILMRFNASRMYHWIRQQAAIKLYVIYNVLEVADRLFSAIGQDVLECLFSREALERRPDGRSKILRPFWLFVLALVYTVVHSTALFYQVITLNVAVNSYSNALITLLMSNQFVEIKSTVFKKFEKDNLFQLTCADVVERFQLWLMLIIIASRNIVETGGLSTGFNLFTSASTTSASSVTNASHANSFTPPRSSSSILPSSFEIIPSLFTSITAYAPSVGHVLGPFIVVLGSEMVIDWLKHAYVNKFNNTRPTIYGRFLDVLAKDYYTNAFADQNLTKRLGLPVIPLSCLFIRAGVQTYHMFMAAWVPPPLPSSATSLTSVHLTTMTSPQPTSTTAAISQQIDALIRQLPGAISSSTAFKSMTTVLVCVLVYLVLLALKLVLGMVLLSFSRSRYRSMKQREKPPIPHVEGSRRVGGWGVVEVDEDKKRWIYEDDLAGAKALKDRNEKERATMLKGNEVKDFERVKRYDMVAKRIW